MSDTERDRMWQIVADIRDAHPRSSDDADSDEIIDALLAAGFGDVTALTAERDALTAKLGLSCGSCHPCTEWANETWVRANERLPHVHEWQEVRAERDALAAQVAAARAVSWHHFGDTEYAAGMEYAREQIIEAMDRAALASQPIPAAEGEGQP